MSVSVIVDHWSRARDNFMRIQKNLRGTASL
jgi:hypothetical protein